MGLLMDALQQHCAALEHAPVDLRGDHGFLLAALFRGGLVHGSAGCVASRCVS